MITPHIPIHRWALALALFCGSYPGRGAEPATATNTLDGATLIAPGEATPLAPPVGLTRLGRAAWLRQRALVAQREAYARGEGARTASQRRGAFQRWEQAHPTEMAELGQMLRDAAREKSQIGGAVGTAASP